MLTINKFFTSGFTFVELILYISLVGMMLAYLTPFAWAVIQGGVKVATEQEVYTQARYVSERIKQEIRNATGINSVGATSISLVVSDSSKNPTVIDLASGKVRVKWGAAPAVDINSVDTDVSSLAFTDYTSTDNKTKHIGFTFTLTDNMSSSRQEYQETINIQSSAEVRSN